MKDAIIKKLKEALEAPITEQQAFYIMGRIRKVLDHLKLEGGKEFPRLRFYCNWALHIEITRVPADIRRILNEAKTDPEKLKEFVELKLLREELNNFLQEINLSTNIVDDDVKWIKFYSYLTHIFLDTLISWPD